MNIYIGNMSYDTTEDQLRTAFESYGVVTSVKIISDQYSGRPKGFGFVEMSSDADANKAITELNGKELNGREISVNEARPRTEGGRGGSGGGRSGGGDRDRNRNRGGNRGGGGYNRY